MGFLAAVAQRVLTSESIATHAYRVYSATNDGQPKGHEVVVHPTPWVSRTDSNSAIVGRNLNLVQLLQVNDQPAMAIVGTWRIAVAAGFNSERAAKLRNSLDDDRHGLCSLGLDDTDGKQLALLHRVEARRKGVWQGAVVSCEAIPRARG